MRNVLIYSDELARFEYGPTHPLKPERAKLMYEFLKKYDLIFHEDQEVIEPRFMNEENLYLFHTKEYIDLLKKGEKGEFSVEMLHAGLGTKETPLSGTMYQYSLLASSGTLQGATMLYQGDTRFVFNPFGGFHHAGRRHAEGFCYINDIAVAVAYLLQKGQKVACIDIDAHHGNGIQDAFYDTNKVLNISLHEAGDTLYPNSGVHGEIGAREGTGFNVNIPLPAGTDDEVYLFAFESLVPPLMECFGPDIVVVAAGCDTHKDDPLSHLNITSNGYKKVISLINDLSPKVLALGSGGYYVPRTAAMWTLAWATFCGLQPRDPGPSITEKTVADAETWEVELDEPPFIKAGQEKDQCFVRARHVVDFIKTNVFPLHGIKR